MGLKFERTDNLDKMFESFAIEPEKKEQPKKEDDLQRFLKPEKDKKKDLKD